MEMHRCYKCFREYPEGEEVCTCGNRHGAEEQPHYALRCGQILNGKYLLGKVLGQGGFGITYVGFDLVLEKKVAIKEYFPVSTGAVSRDMSTGQVVWHVNSSDGVSREYGYQSCMKEARKMAKVEEIPGIVSVRDLFDENNTVYIVMSFIEGITLKEQLKQQGNMSFEECVNTLSPVLIALDRVNARGIIHRDISPDNIMLTPEGTAWVLDMGAAKDLNPQAADGAIPPSSQLTVKAGFSPPEQYMTSGRIGSWTDVYAMSATIYYCVTGKLPPLAPDRMFNDPLTILPPLKDREFDVLKDGMGFEPGARIQTMAELHALLQAALIPEPVVIPVPVDIPEEPKVPEQEPAGQDDEQKITPVTAPILKVPSGIPDGRKVPPVDRRKQDRRWLILILALLLVIVSIAVTLVIQYKKEVGTDNTPETSEETQPTELTAAVVETEEDVGFEFGAGPTTATIPGSNTPGYAGNPGSNNPGYSGKPANPGYGGTEPTVPPEDIPDITNPAPTSPPEPPTEPDCPDPGRWDDY